MNNIVAKDIAFGIVAMFCKAITMVIATTIMLIVTATILLNILNFDLKLLEQLYCFT